MSEASKKIQGFALIRQTRADLFQLRDKGTQGVHGGIESEIRPRRQAKASSVMRSGDEFHELLQIRLGQARPRVSGNTWMRVPRIENR